MFYNNLKGKLPNIEPGHSGQNTLTDMAFIGPPEPPYLRPGSTLCLPVQESVAGQSDQKAYRQAAIYWFQFGMQVIPVLPDTKRTAVKWDPWLDDLSPATIDSYWRHHLDHEVGFIAGPDLIVFDADSREAIAAFNQLMGSMDITCNHIVATSKGEHYYFRLAPGTFAKSDAHESTVYPTRLDVKTGRAMVVLPPSTGKSVSMSETESADGLVEVGQDFIDAVFRHNGREIPRQPEPREFTQPTTSAIGDLAHEISTLLEYIDPDCGYGDWIASGMGIHYEYGGEAAGLELFDSWSSQGSKYPGRRELETKWTSFDSHDGTPVTLGTICKLAVDNGADLEELFEEFFDPIEDIHGVADAAALVHANADAGTEVITHDKADADAKSEEHAWAKFSLRGMSSEFEAEMQEQVAILGDIALLGQWTVVYAPPNAGKTLIGLRLIIDGIKAGKFDPECLFYINADDTHSGLTAKLKLAERYGFNMLAPDYRDFRAKAFLDYIDELCRNRQAKGTIVVLDTLKKFTDPMDKRTVSQFNNDIRKFITQGGTLIGLAHVNKNPGPDGKPVYAGTSDIVDDADCAYVMDTIGGDNDVRTVEFENIKSRGMVAKRAAYQYSTMEGLGYIDLLDSVTPVDDTKAGALRDAAASHDDRDAPLISAIATCIDQGVTAKTKIVEEAASVTGDSKRHAQRVLEDYTGTDPSLHHWNFTIGDRGVHAFELLPNPEDEPDIEEL